jgi:hypothetical protein
LHVTVAGGRSATVELHNGRVMSAQGPDERGVHGGDPVIATPTTGGHGHDRGEAGRPEGAGPAPAEAPTVTREVDLPADVADVWEALTSPPLIGAWFGATVEWALEPGAPMRVGGATTAQPPGRVSSTRSSPPTGCGTGGGRRTGPEPPPPSPTSSSPDRGGRGWSSPSCPSRRPHGRPSPPAVACGGTSASSACGWGSTHDLAAGPEPAVTAAGPGGGDADGVFDALGDPTRRAVLGAVASAGPVTATELARRFPSAARPS